MRLCRKAAPVLLAALLGAPPAGALDVLLPKPKVILDGDSAVVLGTAKPGQTVSWGLEGGDASREGRTRTVGKGAFALAVPLAPGLNRIRVEDRVVEVFRRQEGEAPPAGFRAQRAHAGDVSPCSDCHAADLTLREGGYPGVCLSCHVVEAQNPARRGDPAEDRHFRASTAKCGRCHDPHGATDAKLLTDASSNLCGACHGTREAAPDLHPAFEEGGCAACHDPHFSGYPDQLTRLLPDLCLDCHDVAADEDLGTLHAPLGDGDSCSACHDPHGAGGSLLRAAVPGLCAGCHEEVLSRGHGDDLEDCGACHDAHGRAATALVRPGLEERCSECHDLVPDLRESGASLHEPVAEGACGTCHDPHGSGRGGGLKGTQVQICGECHDVAEAGGGELAHEALESCTDCHDPHGGRNPGFLTRLPPDLCVECHDDPRAEGTRPHQALDEGCLACHAAHVGKGPGLLKAASERGLCLDCHAADEVDGAVGHGPRAAACADCHRPHASDNEHLLSKLTP